MPARGGGRCRRLWGLIVAHQIFPAPTPTQRRLRAPPTALNRRYDPSIIQQARAGAVGSSLLRRGPLCAGMCAIDFMGRDIFSPADRRRIGIARCTNPFIGAGVFLLAIVTPLPARAVVACRKT